MFERQFGKSLASSDSVKSHENGQVPRPWGIEPKVDGKGIWTGTSLNHEKLHPGGGQCPTRNQPSGVVDADYLFSVSQLAR
jgi:hypothetical protein